MESLQPTPDQVALAVVRRVHHVASLPESAARAREVAADPESTLAELGEAFSRDPALCAQLLKVANSAYYGLRAEVTSIERAAALLGRRVLRNVSLAASMQSVWPRGEIHARFSADALWRHSLGTATAAAVIAERSEAWVPQEAFAAGLIHDLGLLVEIESDRKGLARVVDELSAAGGAGWRDRICAIEERHLGAGHQHFGAALCDAWGFPAQLRAVARHHHDPLGAEGETRTLCAVVWLAEVLDESLDHGLRAERGELEIDPAVLEIVGLTAEDLPAVIERVAEAVAEAETAFSFA